MGAGVQSNGSLFGTNQTDLQTCEIRLKGWMGRVGNNILQMINAVGIAEMMGGGIKVIFPRPTADMYSIYNFPLSEFSVLTRPHPERANLCRSPSGEVDTARFANLSRCETRENDFFWLRCRYGFEQRYGVFKDYLHHFLRDDIMKCAKAVASENSSRDTLVVHLRGSYFGICQKAHPQFPP